METANKNLTFLQYILLFCFFLNEKRIKMSLSLLFMLSLSAVSLVFPTYNIAKGTDIKLGRRLVLMGYLRQRQRQGAASLIKEK